MCVIYLTEAQKNADEILARGETTVARSLKFRGRARDTRMTGNLLDASRAGRDRDGRFAEFTSAKFRISALSSV